MPSFFSPENQHVPAATTRMSPRNFLRRLRNRVIAPSTLALQAEIAERSAEAAALRQELAAQAREHETRIEAIEEAVSAMTARFGPIQGTCNALVDQSNDMQAEMRELVRALNAQTEARQAERILFTRDIDNLRDRETQHSQVAGMLLASTLDSLLALEGGQDPGPSAGSPRVSVIVPVRNRPGPVRCALKSLQAQSMLNWEAVVISDGSTDETEAVVDELAETDPRILLLRIPPSGVCAARNHGLAHARGEIIAYLDSDNQALPGYLQQVVKAFDEMPAAQSVYAALVADKPSYSGEHVLWHPWNRETILAGNFIDLNVFSHRRTLYEEYGGFDDQMTRLVDWDLILRYTANSAPVRLPVAGVLYRTDRKDRVTHNADGQRNRVLIYRKWLPKVVRGPRVLFAVQHGAVLLRADVETEIRALQRAGAEIEVWSRAGLSAHAHRFTRLHGGELKSAIEWFEPDVLHAVGTELLAELIVAARTHALPLTLRMDSLERSIETLAPLAHEQGIARLDIFPNQAPAIDPQPWIHVTPVVFDSIRAVPPRHIVSGKNPKLVIQVVGAQSSEDLNIFLHVAERLPDYRFVLLADSASEESARINTLRAELASRGSRVELYVDMPPEQRSALMTRAGLYVDSSRQPTDPGLVAANLPAAVLEALATGALLLLRHSPYYGEPHSEISFRYDDVTSLLACIEETATWDDQTWLRRRIAAIDFAFLHHTDDVMLRPLFDAWCNLADVAAKTLHGPT